MDRHTINCFRNGLLGLASYGSTQRKLLIEEGAAASNLQELIEEWIWTFNLNETDVLRLKAWLSLNTGELAAIFRRSSRDIAQLLRNQRVAQLPAYPALDRAHETKQIAGLSCFMVEQYLSAWLDQELLEIKVGEALVSHCSQCESCRDRLAQYRSLQDKIMSSRPSYPPIDENEWDQALRELQDHSRKQIRRILIILLILVTGASVLSWVFLSKPEKIPNVYELPES